jgi:microcystin-dependent protein
MSNKRISEFPVITSPDPTDIFLIDHLGATSTITLNTITNSIQSNINVSGVSTDGIPIGSVLWFSATAAPLGYLECNGQVVSKSQYNDLWIIIGNTFTTTTSTAHFRVPDLRGEFIRGWDDGKGTDTGRTFGSRQNDAFASHMHDITSAGGGSGGIFIDIYSNGAGPTPITAHTNSVGENETRPRNVALMPCIKASKTVTGPTTNYNFIPKPANATDGQSLKFDGTSNTWVAGTGGGTSGAGIKIFDTPGTYDFIVPDNIKSVKVTLIGGGGGGLIGTANNSGGGGGGAYAIYSIAVIPLTTYKNSIIVGNGGRGNYQLIGGIVYSEDGYNSSCSIGGVTIISGGGRAAKADNYNLYIIGGDGGSTSGPSDYIGKGYGGIGGYQNGGAGNGTGSNGGYGGGGGGAKYSDTNWDNNLIVGTSRGGTSAFGGGLGGGSTNQYGDGGDGSDGKHGVVIIEW